jgi:hypothetical protein
MTSRGLLLFAACAVVVGTAENAAAEDALYAVASRGASAVAAGDDGRILYAWPAPHNDMWNPASSTLTDNLRGVATSASDYVAVGHGGRIMRSIDPDGIGTTWVPETGRTSQDLFGVTHAGNRLVAVGDSAVIRYKLSQDEGSWLIAEQEDIPTNKALRGVAGNTTFATAVGDSGTIVWSLSGGLTVWNLATEVAADADLYGVAPGPGAPPGRFWAVGAGGTILRSLPNVQTWDQLVSPTSVDLNAITFSPQLTQGVIGIAVGDGGTILYSNGGENWMEVDSGISEDLYGVAYTGSGPSGGFVAVGDANVILWSALGVVWEGVLVPVEETSWGSIRGSWATPSSKP